MRAQILLKLGCSFTCEAAGCNTIAHDVLPWHPVVLNPWGAAHELSAADVLSHFSHSSVAGYSTAGTHLLIHFSVHKVVPGLSWLDSNKLLPGQASKLAGALNWASQHMFKRLGRALIYPLYRQQRCKSGRLSKSLTKPRG